MEKSKKDRFLNLASAKDVALLFDKTYGDFSEIFYKTSPRFKYRRFKIEKKRGGFRTICSPNKKIKDIQRILADILLEVYDQKTSVHGFSKYRSILTNAQQHLGKRHIFNIDIEDFFQSIHFGRVKNLFAKKPFSIPHAPAIVLAHICCFDNALPQGAPTSPIITNMICRKMDTALQNLAKYNHCTYSRYADDISFSFTCSYRRLPRDIVIVNKSGAKPGNKLSEIIIKNGFKINNNKTRLCSGNQRLEVTGITVNEFPNVKRKYVQQVKSMLYSWEKHGYKLAEKEYLEKYNKKIRASDVQPKFINLIKGKLAFLYMIRGKRDDIYIKLAKRFNKLAPEGTARLPYQEISTREEIVRQSLWVLEAIYDEDKGKTVANQGTGFDLKDIGLVTCAHVLIREGKPIKEVKAFKPERPSEKYNLEVVKWSNERDLAIAKIISPYDPAKPLYFRHLIPSESDVQLREKVKLYGFPSYKLGQTPYISDAKVASKYAQRSINKFEIDKQIRRGNSGGPVINKDSKVVGIAAEGADMASGNNAVICISELFKLIGG